MQRRKADATSQLALEALDDIFEQFAPDRMSEIAEIALDDSRAVRSRSPCSRSCRRRLLRCWNACSSSTIDSPPKAAATRISAGKAPMRTGASVISVQRSGNSNRPRLPTSRQSTRTTRSKSMVATDSSIAVEIARIYNSLGELQLPAGSPRAGRSFHLQALETLDPSGQTADASPAVRFEMARTCYLLGQGGGPPDMMFGAPPPPPGQPWDFSTAARTTCSSHGPPPDDLLWEPPPGGPGPPPDPSAREEKRAVSAACRRAA